jgi:hypothetical protein
MHWRIKGENAGMYYAQTRANETRCTYLITGIGHVLMDCPENRAFAESEDAGGLAHEVKPQPIRKRTGFPKPTQ